MPSRNSHVLRVKPKARKREDLPPGVPNIFEAAAKNDIAALDVALESWDINAQDELLMSALHHAAAELADKTVDRLLERGIDTTLMDKFGRKADWLAVEVWGEAGAAIADRISFHEAERTILTPDMASHPTATKGQPTLTVVGSGKPDKPKDPSPGGS